MEKSFEAVVDGASKWKQAKCVCALSEWAQKQIHVETILAAVAMWIGVIVIVNRQPCL